MDDHRTDKQRVALAYEKHADTVVRAAWHFTGDIHTARDCAEEAFLKFLSHPEVSEEKELAWLVKVAVNNARNILRSAHYTKTRPLDGISEKGEGDERTLARRAAARAMLSLPEKYRLPLMLHLAQGMTIAQTAQVIGKGANTTASLIRRGKKLLRKAYEKEEL